MPVKLGYTEGEWTEIRDGLKEGEQVVTAGKVALRDGTAVQLINAAADKATATTKAKVEADGSKQ